MKKTHLIMASAVLVLAGCGDKDKAVVPETVDQAVQETVADVEMVAVENQTAESADTAVAAAEEATLEVVEPATETVAVVTEQATAEVAGVAEQVQEPAAAAPDLAQGEAIYKKSCLACHGTGAAGAPKLGETDIWAPRIAQGMDTLAQHAIGGFKGAKDYILSAAQIRRCFMSLSDAEVTAAVAYMVSESR